MECIQSGRFGRTCLAVCPLAMGRISDKSSNSSSVSKNPRQQFLCLRDGSTPERSWVTVILSPGASSTPRRVGESHKDGKEYFLSSILLASVPERYSLSQKACLGILRRARLRGKELPEVLRKALERQAQQSS